MEQWIPFLTLAVTQSKCSASVADTTNVSSFREFSDKISVKIQFVHQRRGKC